MEGTALKCMVVGDGAVGKTCLLMSYVSDKFPEDHTPTIFDHYTTDVLFEDKRISLGLWDTAGQSSYDKLRPLSYPATDVFIVCFSLANRVSLRNVESKWVPEIREHCPKVPFLIVGTKLDLKQEMGDSDEVVLLTEVESVARRTGASLLIECSAKTQEGLVKVFEEAVRAALRQKESTNKALRSLADAPRTAPKKRGLSKLISMFNSDDVK